MVENGTTLGEPVPSWNAAYGARPWLRRPPSTASAVIVPIASRRRRPVTGGRDVAVSWRDRPLTTTSGRGRSPNSGSSRIIAAITKVNRTSPMTAW